MKRSLLIGFIALLPVLAACTSATATKPSAGAASGTATQQLTVKAMDTMKFDPPTLSAKAGQPIQVTLDNTGQLVHDFSVTEGVSQPVKTIAQPGQKAVTTFTIDETRHVYLFLQPAGSQRGRYERHANHPVAR